MKTMKPFFLIIFLYVLIMMKPSAFAFADNIEVSDHFDGSRFFNEEPDFTFHDKIKWLATTKIPDWPEWIKDPVMPPPPERVGAGELRVTYVNHATLLIQMDGLNILTDPIWSKRSSPVSWAGPQRVRAPGVSLKNLPPIDIVLVSHDHYDHLDLPSLKLIAAKHNPMILVGLGVRALLVSQRLENVIEMDWWQEYTPAGSETKIVFVPARHNSGRGIFDRNKTLWGGFVMQSPAGNVYFAGDTAYGKYLNLLGERFGSFRLALLPVGEYLPRWFMKTQHMNPDDAVRAHKFLNVAQSVGMHFGTFSRLSEQTFGAHEKDLRTALKKHRVQETEFWLLGFGEGRNVAKYMGDGAVRW